MKKLILLVTTIAMLIVVLAACSGKQSGTGSSNTVVDADVVIEKSTFSETAQFIPVKVDDTEMEIIAVEAPDGTLRTALNTCQVCYDSGRGYYEQDDDVLVCQNCGNRFMMSQVSVEKGGCNPVGISDDMRSETDEAITIPLDLLKQAVPFFVNWKKS
jgi:hypothetical protein